MATPHDAYAVAVKTAFYRRFFRLEQKTIEIAVLIPEADWRPLKAPWWRGKDVCIIGADLDGNFLLRHCDGTVRYWNHREGTDTVLAPSVRAFATQLQE